MIDQCAINNYTRFVDGIDCINCLSPTHKCINFRKITRPRQHQTTRMVSLNRRFCRHSESYLRKPDYVLSDQMKYKSIQITYKLNRTISNILVFGLIKCRGKNLNIIVEKIC